MSENEHLENLASPDKHADNTASEQTRAQCYEGLGSFNQGSTERRQAATAACEKQGLLPTVAVAEQADYVPGYSYSQKEAEKYFKQCCAEDSPSNSEIEFMRAYHKVIEGHKDGESPPSENHAAEKPAAEMHESTTIQGGTQQTRFELGSEADKVAWDRWQHRMNDAINDKLQTLVAGSGVTLGKHADLTYTVGDNGSFNYQVNGNDTQFNSIVNKAINDTLRYHPELLKFPQGTKDTEVKRTATFDTNGGTGYRTGEVKDEIYKR